MRRKSGRRWAAWILMVPAAAALSAAQTSPSLKEIVSKNIEAAGGMAKLAQFKTLSFRTGGTRYFVSAAGELKTVTGRDPAVTETVLIAGGKVIRNSFGIASEITGPQAMVLKTMAGLYGGLFSMAKFEDQLVLVGVESFGLEKFYHLTPNVAAGPVTVHFYLRTNDSLLKRLVFSGKSAEGDKYEVNYDFAPFEEVAGLKLPLSWFASQVGTSGDLTEIAEVKTGVVVPKDFFAKAEINIGRTEASPGQMKGNILDWDASPYGLTIVTNWTRKDTDAAGLKTGDKLLVLIGDDQYRLSFFAQSDELPPWNELPTVGPLLAPMQAGSQAFAIQVYGGAGSLSADKLTPLAALSVKKIAN